MRQREEHRVDRVLGRLGAAPQADVVGDWFFVYTNLSNAPNFKTTRTILAVGDENAFSRRATYTSGPRVFLDDRGGSLCADEIGRFEMKMPFGSLSGRHLDGHLALVMRMGEGSPADVDGTYNLVWVSLVPSRVQWGPGGVIPLGALYTHDGDRTMAAGWYATDTNATRMYQSGFIAPSGRFIVGWTASAPNDPGPGLLEGAPRPGSLLHMLRP